MLRPAVTDDYRAMSLGKSKVGAPARRPQTDSHQIDLFPIFVLVHPPFCRQKRRNLDASAVYCVPKSWKAFVQRLAPGLSTGSHRLPRSQCILPILTRDIPGYRIFNTLTVSEGLRHFYLRPTIHTAYRTIWCMGVSQTVSQKAQMPLLTQ